MSGAPQFPDPLGVREVYRPGATASKAGPDALRRLQNLEQGAAGRPGPGVSNGSVLTSDTSQTGGVRWNNYGIVTTFPGSPVDGQECRIQTSAMATVGVVWAFKYRSATSKWEFIGGPALGVNIDTVESRSSSAFGNLTTAEDITISFAGLYTLEYGAEIANTTGTASAGLYSPSGAGVTASDTNAVRADFNTSTSGVGFGVSRKRNFTLTTGTLRMQARSSGSVALNFGLRFLYITPISVA